MSLVAVMVAHNEPEWVQKLTFGGVPVAVEVRHRPDVVALCADGASLWIERKTSEDFLGALKEEGNLFLQCAALSHERIKNNVWPYLLITGHLAPTADGMCETERGKTGWNWASVQGALLAVQEMGVFIAYASGDADFEGAVMRIAKRNRKAENLILPARPPAILPREYAVLADLGIGPERAKELLKHCGTLEIALIALADDSTDLPKITKADRVKVRSALYATNH